MLPEGWRRVVVQYRVLKVWPVILLWTVALSRPPSLEIEQLWSVAYFGNAQPLYKNMCMLWLEAFSAISESALLFQKDLTTQPPAVL